LAQPDLQHRLKIFSKNFAKGLDKDQKVWYTALVIQRQQVPLKAFASLPRSHSKEFSPFCALSSAMGQRKLFLIPALHFFTGGERKMPSTKILEQKKAATAALTESIRNAQAGVLVNYTGISVEQDTALRKALREAGVSYHVYKNTMTGRACDEVGYGEMKQYLTGMTALATSETDPIAPAKILKQYAEKIECFEIKAGFIDGAVIDAKAVNELADTPSRETMVCKIMGSMMSSLYGLAYVLQAKIDKDGDAQEAPAQEAAAE
jgi:large subunit ribosomal protein L10